MSRLVDWVRKTSRLTTIVFAALFVILLALLVAGCGTSSASGGGTVNTVPQTLTIAPKWPDVPVTPESVKGAAKQILGATVAPKIQTVRSTNVVETSPGHFNLVVQYNQPGMCHSSGTATWRVQLLQQYAFNLFLVLYKHPQVDRVELEAYATPDPSVDDPQKFEKVSRMVTERGRVANVSWGADRAYATIPNFASEYWVTPKAS